MIPNKKLDELKLHTLNVDGAKPTKRQRTEILVNKEKKLYEKYTFEGLQLTDHTTKAISTAPFHRKELIDEFFSKATTTKLNKINKT